MDYTIVTLQEKLTVGLPVRTNNQAKDMPDKISSVWHTFYEAYYASIPNQVSSKGLGIYTAYAGDYLSDYTMLAALEVSQLPPVLLPSLVSCKIPKGTYAKFILQGKIPEVVTAFWQELWIMSLPRAFTCDFEEYTLLDPMGQAEICVYIALQ